MARRHSFTTAFGLAMAGTMLLAACGGGNGDSRARNSAFESVADCYSSQDLKDADIARLTGERDKVTAAEADLNRLTNEMNARANEATAKWTEFSALPGVVRGNTLTDQETEDVRRVSAEYDAALKAAKAASAAQSEAYGLIARKDLVASQLAAAEAKPVCAQTVDNSADAPSTSSDTEGDDETTTDAPTTSTGDVTSTGDGGNDSPPTTNSLEISECGRPSPREGREFTVDKGASLAFTFDLCGLSTGIGVQSDNWPDTVLERYFNEDRVVVHTVLFPNVGTARLGFLGYNQPTNQLVTEPVFVTVTVRESSANDPCAGKAPEGTWDPDFEGGSFVATSTCDNITTLKVVVDRIVDDERTEVFNGYLGSGLPHTDLIQMFGEGTYKVYLRHVTRPSIDDEWMTLGDAGWVDVTYTAPKTNTVSNGATEVPVRRDGSVALPVFAFDPSTSEAPANPRDADAGVSVVAIPADAPVITCDQACIDALVARVDASAGTVEISFGTADFETVTAGGSFVPPVGATSVRVRVTPTDGEPVTMAAVFTRDSVDEAYADVAMDEVRTEVSNVTSDEGSSFPWWIIVLLVVVLAAAEAERRRRKSKAVQAGS